jgi:hypothetical protein
VFIDGIGILLELGKPVLNVDQLRAQGGAGPRVKGLRARLRQRRVVDDRANPYVFVHDSLVSASDSARRRSQTSGEPRDDLKADRVEPRHPVQRVIHVFEGDLARDEPCRAELSTRHEREQLGIPRMGVAE